MTRPDLKDPLYLIAFAFGAGKLPFLRGTAATLVGMIIFVLFADMPTSQYVTIVFLGFITGLYVCDVVARELDDSEHKGIVWDQVVGYWITMTALPVDWPHLIAGLLLFRLLMILKPWLFGWIGQRLKGGLGIMLDDVVAGVIACVALHAISDYLPPLHTLVS